jgi:hypothetical protein
MDYMTIMTQNEMNGENDSTPFEEYLKSGIDYEEELNINPYLKLIQ